MSNEEKKQDSFETVIEKRTRYTLNDVRIVLGIGVSIIVTLFGGGWYAFGQVDERATKISVAANQVRDVKLDAAIARIAAVEERQLASDAAVNHRLDRLDSTLTRVVENQEGLRDDLRAAFPARIPPRSDGGQ